MGGTEYRVAPYPFLSSLNLRRSARKPNPKISRITCRARKRTWPINASLLAESLLKSPIAGWLWSCSRPGCSQAVKTSPVGIGRASAAAGCGSVGNAMCFGPSRKCWLGWPGPAMAARICRSPESRPRCRHPRRAPDLPKGTSVSVENGRVTPDGLWLRDRTFTATEPFQGVDGQWRVFLLGRGEPVLVEDLTR